MITRNLVLIGLQHLSQEGILQQTGGETERVTVDLKSLQGRETLL